MEESRRLVTLVGGYECWLTAEEHNDWTEYVRDTMEWIFYQNAQARLHALTEAHGSESAIEAAIKAAQKTEAALFAVGKTWMEMLEATRPFPVAEVVEEEPDILADPPPGKAHDKIHVSGMWQHSGGWLDLYGTFSEDLRREVKDRVYAVEDHMGMFRFKPTQNMSLPALPSSGGGGKWDTARIESIHLTSDGTVVIEATLPKAALDSIAGQLFQVEVVSEKKIRLLQAYVVSRGPQCNVCIQGERCGLGSNHPGGHKPERLC